MAENSKYINAKGAHNSKSNAARMITLNSMIMPNDAKYANTNLKNSTRPAYFHTVL